MECSRKKSDALDETYEIHVSFTNSASWYERLRLLLLGSKWFPKLPLGMLVWSALHTVLVVGGASFWLLAWVYAIAMGLWLHFTLVAGLGFLILVMLLWQMCYSIWSLMRVSWALMLCDGQGIKVAWKDLEGSWRVFLDGGCKMLVRITPLFWHFVKGKELRDGWRMVGRWCEEVVHLHDTFVI